VAGEVGNNCVHRARFLDTLVALLPEGVAQFGKKVQDVQTRSDGKMTLLFADGTRAEADAVIGCDGVKSSLRPILLGKDHEATQAVFSGRYAYRGLIPMDKAVAALGDELARNSQMYLGRHGHVLTFPIEKGTIMNVVAFRAKPDGKWENEQWVLPMKKEDMFNDYVDWGDSVKKILQLMEKPDVWALFDHPPAPTYYKHNLCIAGDAAHASTPHQGAGAGQAIEDAFVLSNLLGQVTSSSGLEQAFKAYDAIRRPRSQKNVKTSRETSAVYEFEDEEISGDLEKIRWTLENRYRWIWEEDLNEQLARAKALMTGTGEQQKASL
jgi:salicylate hydroxylase